MSPHQMSPLQRAVGLRGEAEPSRGGAARPPVEVPLPKTQPGRGLVGDASASLPPSPKMLRSPRHGAIQLPVSLRRGGGGKGTPASLLLLAHKQAASFLTPGSESRFLQIVPPCSHTPEKETGRTWEPHSHWPPRLCLLCSAHVLKGRYLRMRSVPPTLAAHRPRGPLLPAMWQPQAFPLISSPQGPLQHFGNCLWKRGHQRNW